MSGVTIEATRYTVCAVNPAIPNADLFTINVERTAPDRWAVRRGSQCLDAVGRWESIPAVRSDEWLVCFGHRLDMALRLAKDAAAKVTVDGWTVERVNAEWSRESA